MDRARGLPILPEKEDYHLTCTPGYVTRFAITDLAKLAVYLTYDDRSNERMNERTTNER